MWPELKTYTVDQESIKKGILTYQGQAIANTILANIAKTGFAVSLHKQ
jgi:hypothetical protein